MNPSINTLGEGSM